MRVDLVNWATTSMTVPTPIPCGLVISHGTPYQVPANKMLYVTRIHVMFEGAASNAGIGQAPTFTYSTSVTFSPQTTLEIYDGSQAHDLYASSDMDSPLYIIPSGMYFGLYMGLTAAVVGAGIGVAGYVE